MRRVAALEGGQWFAQLPQRCCYGLRSPRASPTMRQPSAIPTPVLSSSTATSPSWWAATPPPPLSSSSPLPLLARRFVSGRTVAGTYQSGHHDADDPFDGPGGNFGVVIGPTTTMTELWQQAVKAYAPRRFMGSKMWVRGRLGYVWTTYDSINNEINAARLLLAKMGLRKGGRLAIVSENRYEFFTLLIAAMQLGSQVIILPTNITPSDAKVIVKNSQAKVLVVETLASHTAVRGWVGHVGELEHTLCFEQQLGDDSYAVAISIASESLQHVMSEEGATHPYPPVDAKPEETALICFTAGTTGVPKGVMLSHKALIAAISSTHASLGEAVTHQDLFSSLLSWTVVAGLTAELFQVIVKGASIAVPPDTLEGFLDLPLVNPNVIVSVAAPFVKAYNNIAEDVTGANFIKGMALSSTLSHLTDARVNYSKPGRITRKASQVLLDKYKQQFGDKLRCIFIVGQALHKDHLDLFFDLDLFIVQTYAVTEAGGVIASDLDVSTRMKLLPGVEVRVVNDENQVVVPGDIGEILIEAPHAMQGYFHTHISPEDAGSALMVYGSRTFVRTGDFGTLTGNWLTVKGHKDVLITLRDNKVVDPIEAEMMLIKSPFIKQCFLFGDNRDYVVALIVPAPTAISAFLKRVDRRDGQPIVSEREKADVVRYEIRKYCARLSDPRVYPRRFAFVGEFTHANGFLTNKWTTARFKVEKHYVHYINALYDDSPKFFGYAVDDYDDLF